MRQILAIIKKHLQWTRRPLYFISSILLGVLIITCVGNTLAGAENMPFGLYDPAGVSDLGKIYREIKKIQGYLYDDLDKAKGDLARGRIVALANVSQDPLEDSVQILTKDTIFGRRSNFDGLVEGSHVLGKRTALPLHSATLFRAIFTARLYHSWSCRIPMLCARGNELRFLLDL